MRLALLLSLFAGGCIYEWNDQQPAFTLGGAPLPASSFDKINAAPAGRFALMSGPDGASWAAFCEFWSLGESAGNVRNCKRLRLVRVDGAADDELIDADGFSLHGEELFVMRDDTKAMPMTRTVTMHRPGDPAALDVAFTMPAGRALLYANDDGAADVFVYWVLDKDTTRYGIFRRDRAYQRNLALPDGIDVSQPEAQRHFDFLLTREGDTLVARTPDGQMTAYDTRDAGAVALGMRPETFFIDNQHRAVLTVGDDGLRAVPLTGGPDVVLSSLDVDATTLWLDGDRIFFAAAGGLWRAPLIGGGSAPAVEVQPGAARLLALGPRGELVYSRDPVSRYAGGAGDGWLGDRRFMERGRLLRWSGDGTRLRFLEHAATLGTYGDLTSVAVADGMARVLGINVHNYDELPDGRVLAIENAVYAGTWNRLVVIDEATGEKRWVAAAAADFSRVPDGPQVLIDAVSGASGVDILRLPSVP
jgi:hypothetical protein